MVPRLLPSNNTSHGAEVRGHRPFRAAHHSATGCIVSRFWPWCVLGKPHCRDSVLKGPSAGMGLQNAAMTTVTRRIWTVCVLGTQVRQLAVRLDKNNTVLPAGPTTTSLAWHTSFCPNGTQS